jgi:predicted NAD/FAD-dependent oxidoreductase
VHFTGDQVAGLRLAGGEVREFDFVVLAVPWRRVPELLPAELQARIDPDHHFEHIQSAPITALHLWFDRSLTNLPHAVLVGRLAQWVFAGRGEPKSEHYYQVVISASHDLAGRERQPILDEVLGDLRSIFPAADGASLLRWQLITQPESVFSVRPGLDLIRPLQQPPVPNLLLAGDWTRTGWPATMEGAVRSGYLAAEGILSQLGRPLTIVVPDLPRGWLVQWLGASG